MTAEELKDICLCGETTKVQFKETPIPQKELAREMIAFANSKGGVMLFGVADKMGEIHHRQATAKRLAQTSGRKEIRRVASTVAVSVSLPVLQTNLKNA